jgi:hypothetical protein
MKKNEKLHQIEVLFDDCYRAEIRPQEDGIWDAIWYKGGAYVETISLTKTELLHYITSLVKDYK